MKVVDLFCGAGGSSTGAAMAGHEVIAAADYWDRAIESHRANHPRTQHLRINLGDFDLNLLPRHDCLIGSPPCTGFSRARGAEKPDHEDARKLSWVIPRVAEAFLPPRVVMENVPEFLKWDQYPAWRRRMEDAGYTLAIHTFNASTVGVPQFRERMIITASLGDAIKIELPTSPLVPVRSVLDMDQGPWKKWDTYVPTTVARVRSAMAKQGGDCLVPYYSSPSSANGRSLDEPCGTLTTRDRYLLVRGKVGRMLSVREQMRIQGFPETYVLTGSRREQTAQNGNAVPPLLMRAVLNEVAKV